jgi:hypothetical protein
MFGLLMNHDMIKSSSLVINAVKLASLRSKALEAFLSQFSSNQFLSKEVASQEIKLILGAFKTDSDLTDDQVDALEILILQDLYEWGPITDILKLASLERIEIRNDHNCLYLLNEESSIGPVPFSLHITTYLRLLGEIESSLGYNLSLLNPIGVTKLREDLYAYVGFKSEYLPSTILLLKHSEMSPELLESRLHSSLNIQLRTSSYSTLSPSSDLQAAVKRFIGTLKWLSINTDVEVGESSEAFLHRLLTKYADHIDQSDLQLHEYYKNYLMGLGPLEWILGHPDFSSVTIWGTNKISYRLKTLASTMPCFEFPLLFESEADILNVIERIVAPFGYRCDEQFPIQSFTTGDGHKVEIGLPYVLNQIFLRITRLEGKI